MPFAFGRHEQFKDRREAGRQLAALLAKYRDAKPLVLALPRGGVPVGYEIARALDAPLDVFIVRKLGAPQQPELGIGAVAPGGVLIIDTDTVRVLHITEEEIRSIAAVEAAEMERRLNRFRGDRALPEVRGRTVILVDDGLATGVTAFAAVQALRQLEPARIVLAAPVCASQTAHALSSEVDDLVCMKTPLDFGAVGLWYRDFEQTTDDEVVSLLETAHRALICEGDALQPKQSEGEP